MPATGWDCFLKWYDPLVRYCTQEEAFKTHLVDLATISPDSRILDVGCGSGTLALALSDRYSAVQIVGIDADARILTQARCKDLAARVQWEIANVTSLPFADQSFSHVFCTLLFHHLSPIEKISSLREIKRVLRPGGEFLFADFGRPASYFARLRFLPARLIDGWQRTFCNVSGLIPQMFQEVGFSKVSETLEVASLLGTIRCMRAENPKRR